MRKLSCCVVLCVLCVGVIVRADAPAAAESAADRALAGEVKDMGTICFGARTPTGDWDLFTMRPDGSNVRNLTNTPNTNEALPRFSPDGTKLLYRRTPKDERFDNNDHGTQGELIIADADGRNTRAIGKAGEYRWASWSPDGKQIACLNLAGLQIVDVQTGKIEKTLKRGGFFQQMSWSPDGRWFVGVSNGFGTTWSVARLDPSTGKANAISTTDCCTPDWFADSKRVIFSRRPGQWTQLWMADGDGSHAQMIYAEEGRHVYGGCVSPDQKYVIFTGNAQEDGDPGSAGAPMNIMRLADAPITGPVQPNSPKAMLKLLTGYEPTWVVLPNAPAHAGDKP